MVARVAEVLVVDALVAATLADMVMAVVMAVEGGVLLLVVVGAVTRRGSSGPLKA